MLVSGYIRFIVAANLGISASPKQIAASAFHGWIISNQVLGVFYKHGVGCERNQPSAMPVKNEKCI